MGDSRRSVIFAEWIEKQFPPRKFHKVIDFGGGTGRVSMWLKKCGYDPTIVDKRKSKVPLGIKKIRKDASTLSFNEGEYDFVVGMHPDGATLPAIRAASEIGCPFAVVPCCAIVPSGYHIPKFFNNWEKFVEDYAKGLGFDTWTGQLYMKGKNIVIKGFK